MEAASPVKRRVLGALDPNASSPKVRHDLKQQRPAQSPIKTRPASTAAGLTRALTRTPEPDSPTRKRPSMAPGAHSSTEEPPLKRPCLGSDGSRVNAGETGQSELDPDTDLPRITVRPSPSRGRSIDRSNRTPSPSIASTASITGSPSVFDTSTAANDTTLTESDHDNSQSSVLPLPVPTAPATAPVSQISQRQIPPTTAATGTRSTASSRFTLEQAREKAEILRLRLELASYKVRTNQTDVPLDELQVRPVPVSGRSFSSGSYGRSVGASSRRRPLPSSPPARRTPSIEARGPAALLSSVGPVESGTGRVLAGGLEEKQLQGKDEGCDRRESGSAGTELSELSREPSVCADTKAVTGGQSAVDDEGHEGDLASDGAASGLLSLARG
ncbi:hypothetical protein N656DRAFT_842966 [Canariomyces notabilis]|uniref:Uncharacterized protein n=1 Tax=Canariomyces notabilis TaxID=2074819 RepID=A0AAN6YV31_9PEZI|nr:hypothetical protein N656DRAFT_842966 [Canariomyces arenarius]